MIVCLKNLEEKPIIIFALKNYHQLHFWIPSIRVVIVFPVWVTELLCNCTYDCKNVTPQVPFIFVNWKQKQSENFATKLCSYSVQLLILVCSYDGTENIRC